MSDRECDNGCFGNKIERMIEREVGKRLDVKQKQIEWDNEHYRAEMWKARKAESRAKSELAKVREDAEKQTRGAIKAAQREYYFDCAIGDTVYIVDLKFIVAVCSRCDNKRKVKVDVDGVRVDADCPVCGDYSKRKRMEKFEPYIVTGKVERLQIEMTANKKWVKVWLANHGNEYGFSAENDKQVFRTQEEANEALKKMQEEEGGI